MKKGDVVKCVNAKRSSYLTNGKNYNVSSGKGDVGEFGYMNSNSGFEITDDDGDVIFQYRLDGLHGLFKVQK